MASNSKIMAEHIFPSATLVDFNERQKMMKQKPMIIWLTGLSGSGKTTIAQKLEVQLLSEGFKVFLLDGDSLRDGLNKDLGFTVEDRKENIRRAGEICKLFFNAGMIVITSFISPLEEDRMKVRSLFPPGSFVEVYVNTPLEVCEARDVKGLYSKARAGIINNFTGISSPYEVPHKAEVVIDTTFFSIDECVYKLRNQLDLKIDN